ncbi:hypothetical protein ACFQ1S_00255 [Kibdelosporangium lantanae]|uniref:Uncharacterized protein n=1 Tax=Kibdelosporangium lantanae TaxID=1497396 RepID=A0ABW3M3H7_9PSEU
MVAIYEAYTREMYDEYGYFAVWLPSVPLALGDVGTFAGHRFDKLTTLADLGISFRSSPTSRYADVEYSSSGAVSLAADGAVGVTRTAPMASLSITFSREGATFFQGSECTERSIDNLPELESALLPLCRSRTWRPDYVVVTRLVSTGPTMVLVSKDSGAQVKLSLDADGQGTPLPFAKAAGNFVMTAKSGLAASVVTPDGATPLFRVACMRRKLLGGRELEIRGGGAQLDLELAPVEWDDRVTA